MTDSVNNSIINESSDISDHCKHETQARGGGGLGGLDGNVISVLSWFWAASVLVSFGCLARP